MSALQFASIIEAAEISYVSDSKIQLIGEIKPGDAEHLESLLFSDPVRFLRTQMLSIDSPGGNVSEAQRIAQLVEDTRLTVLVPESANCASACFIIFASASVRLPSGTVAVHRPYLPKAVHDDASIAFVIEAQKQATAAALAFLRDRSVSESLLEHMISTPSTQAYILSTDDLLKSLRIFSHAWEEVLIARCNLTEDHAKLTGDPPWTCIRHTSERARFDLLAKLYSPEVAIEATRQILIDSGGIEVEGGRIIPADEYYANPSAFLPAYRGRDEAGESIEAIDELWNNVVLKAESKGIFVEDPINSVDRIVILINHVLPSLARRGDAKAAFQMGILFSQFINNGEQAVQWFKSAARLGERQALGFLAVHYELGQGVEVDKPRALAYYLLADEYGLENAQEAATVLVSELSREESAVAHGLKASIKSSLPEGMVD